MTKANKEIKEEVKEQSAVEEKKPEFTKEELLAVFDSIMFEGYYEEDVTIKGKLKVATAASIKAEHFGVGRYEDIKEIYEVVMSKQHFSISEIEALCDELKRLKDNG